MRGRMPKRNSKRAKNKESPTVAKRPRTEQAPQPELQTVRYSFMRFDPHRWYNSQYKLSPFQEIAKCLKDYEHKTWRQVRANFKRDHPIDPDRICTEAKHRLVGLKVEEMDELWSFRIDAKRRVWGARFGRTFFVLWWDPQHQVYPTEPSNT